MNSDRISDGGTNLGLRGTLSGGQFEEATGRSLRLGVEHPRWPALWLGTGDLLLGAGVGDLQDPIARRTATIRIADVERRSG